MTTPALATRSAPFGLALMLAGLSMLSPFATDAFFPSFRDMQAEFGLTDLEIQQTLTVYLLPYAFMSLVYGALSDAVGRRRVVLFGMVVFTLASIACVLAPSFGSLLVFRAAQGMTAGAGLAVSRAIVRDLYHGADAQRLMSTITMIFSLAPAIAPVVGGWIHVMAGWRSVFGLLAVLGCALWIAVWFRLPETHPPEKRIPLDVGALARQGWAIAGTPEFRFLAFAAAINFGATLAYIGSAPAIVFDEWKLDETQFHWLFVPIIGGFVVGAFVSGRIAGRVPAQSQLYAGFVVAMLASLAGALLHALHPAPPIPLQQLVMFCTSMGVQLVFPPLTLRMLDLFPLARGTAASVQTFASLIMATAIIGVGAPLIDGSMVLLSCGSLFAAVASFLSWRMAVASRGAPGAPHEAHRP